MNRKPSASTATASVNNAQSAPDTVIKRSTDPCPLYPSATSTAIGDRIQPDAPRGLVITLTTAPPLAAQMEIRYRISFSRSSQKRGPPTNLQA